MDVSWTRFISFFANVRWNGSYLPCDEFNFVTFSWQKVYLNITKTCKKTRISQQWGLALYVLMVTENYCNILIFFPPQWRSNLKHALWKETQTPSWLVTKVTTNSISRWRHRLSKIGHAIYNPTDFTVQKYYCYSWKWNLWALLSISQFTLTCFRKRS